MSHERFDPERLPAKDRRAFICPRCDVYARQTWFPVRVRDSANRMTRFRDTPVSSMEELLARDDLTDDQRREAISVLNPFGSGDWNAAQCESCKAFSLWRDELMIYPANSPAPSAHPDMPEEVQALYVEARNVMPVSRRAGAALARATLEALLKNLFPEHSARANLETRISLASEVVSGPLAELLTVVRHAGNKALHVDENPDELTVLVLDPQDVEVAEFLFIAINDLVEERVTRPRQTSALFDKLPRSVRDRIKGARGEQTGEEPA